MFDFHLHLARFESPDTVARELLGAGVGFNTIACEPWEWDATMKFNSSGPDVHFAFGIHPMVATKTSSGDMERLEQILRAHPQYHVGECGLDKRFEGYEPAGIQEQVFQRQVKLAQELNRPLQVHCVGDYSRIIKSIAEIEVKNVGLAKQIPQVVFHRFGGDISVVKSALKQLDSRAIFSLHADSFRKKSTVAAIREIPSGQVRFETDADDESWNAKAIVEKLQDVQRKYGEIPRTL